jgi:hypothetical protein
MVAEQRVRALLFYASVCIFCGALPFILSFALGYQFDRRTFKFTKTGLIALKTQPPGADIYFEQKLMNEKTPATINELLPGTYNIRLELENHYPWHEDVRVEAGKVTRLEKVVLFSERQNIKQLNKEKIAAFWIDQEKDTIYYVNPEENTIYTSNLNGERYEIITGFQNITPLPSRWKISMERDKLLYFNEHQIGIVGLQPFRGASQQELSFVLNYPAGKIIDVFWYSDGGHCILVSNKGIEVLEARPDAEPMTLVTLTKRNTSAFYDMHDDTLYFLDSQKAADGKMYDNLYKLDLRSRIFPLKDLIKLKPNE